MHLDTQIKSRIREARQMGAPLRDPSILIVEDDAALKQIWLMIIDRVAPNALIDWVLTEEAAERAIRDKIRVGELYDIVIADIFLAGKRSGIDLLKRYGSDGCEFIIVSGATREKVKKMVGDDESLIFLQKPIQFDAAVREIARLLGFYH